MAATERSRQIGHDHLRPDAEFLQMPREPVCPRIHLTVGQAFGAVNERASVRRSRDGGLDEMMNAPEG